MNLNTQSGRAPALDPEIGERLLENRREFVRNSILKLGALASAPLVLAASAQQAFGQNMPQQVVDVLNYALTLEYLEDAFYRTGLEAGVIPQEYETIFQHIGLHEAQHVEFLSGALGSAAVPPPALDLTAGGKYADVLENFQTFLTLSITFEDLGVAAYKGQAGNLMEFDDLLTAALQIHSVEARHAAIVRKIGGMKSWDGAFDEPKSMDEVLAAAGPFLA